MLIKRLLARLVEKITGKKCSRCRYNCVGHCTHPSDSMFMRCWHGITRPGYEPRPGKYEKITLTLTAEERHQLAMIKNALQEASDTARDGGLVED